MSEQPLHPAVDRIVREHVGGGDVLTLLGESLSGTDLTALLLEVMRRRAEAVSPAKVLRAYERDRFVRPAAVDARRLLEIELLALTAVTPPFVAVATAPLVPLGTHAVADVHQNRIVTTVRRSEVAADPTNSLALEAAMRRRRLLTADPRSSTVVHLASTDRVVRAQRFHGPRSFAHFTLLGLVSAGRDTGDHSFEFDGMREHLRALTRVADDLGVPRVTIGLTDFGGHHEDVLHDLVTSLASHDVEVTIRSDRTAARGYYPGLCFKLSVVHDGEEIEVGDGGIVTWTQSLLGSHKERLMTSGLSLERLALIQMDERPTDR